MVYQSSSTDCLRLGAPEHSHQPPPFIDCGVLPVAKRLRPLERYIGARGPGRKIALVGLVDMFGGGLHLTILPIFLVNYAGVTAAQVGFVVGATGVVALFAPYLAGILTDRAGPLRVWKVTTALRMVAYALFAGVDSFPAYCLLAFTLAPLDRVASNAQLSYLVAAFPVDERNTVTAAVRSCRNAGLSLGLLSASAFIAIGTLEIYQLAFVFNAFSFAVMLAGLLTLNETEKRTAPAVETAERGEDSDAPPSIRVRPWADRRYLQLTVGDGMMSVHVTVLFVVFPLWMASQDHIPLELTGALLAMNSVLTVILQPYLASHGIGLGRAKRLICVAGPSLVVSGALFWGASVLDSTAVGVSIVVLAMLALTVGENLQEVAVFEASHRLAPPAAIGRYLGVFSTGDAAQRIVAPSILTGAIVATPLGWGLVALFTGAGSLLVLRAIGEEE